MQLMHYVYGMQLPECLRNTLLAPQAPAFSSRLVSSRLISATTVCAGKLAGSPACLSYSHAPKDAHLVDENHEPEEMRGQDDP